MVLKIVSGSSEVNSKRGLMSLDTPESSEGGSIDNNEYAAAGDNEGGRRAGSKRYSFSSLSHYMEHSAKEKHERGILSWNGQMMVEPHTTEVALECVVCATWKLTRLQFAQKA